MFPTWLGKTIPPVLVTVFNHELVDESMKTTLMLRQLGLHVQVYFDPDPLREQISYAVKKGIPLLVIPGPDELAQGKLAIRDLRTTCQELVAFKDAAEFIKRLLL